MATNMISALGAGSGVDVKALAQSLVDAEKVPREDAINAKIDKQDRKVAGYSAMMLSLETLKTAFQKLNDKNDFNAATAASSDTSVLTASTSSAALPGRHSIEVTQLASPQRSAAGNFASATSVLNGGAAFGVRLAVNGVDFSSIDVVTTTPQGVVDAINLADQGVTAQLIDTGSGSTPYRIVLTGPMGADGVFSFTTEDDSGAAKSDTLSFGAATSDGTITVAGVAVEVTAGDSAIDVADKVYAALTADTFMSVNVGRTLTSNNDGTLTLVWDKDDGDIEDASFVDTGATGATMAVTNDVAYAAGASVAALDVDANDLQTATDAVAKVNGLTLTRSTNMLDDAIPGLYIDLASTNVGAPIELRVTRDTATVKDNIKALVDSYNTVMTDFDILTGERSDDEADIYSGSLANDSTVKRIQTQLRSMFLGESTTPSGAMNAMRDIGLDIDRNGVLSIDDTKLDAALTGSFSDVMTMLSAGTNNQSEVGTAGRGVAGEAVKSINALISSRGTIATQSANATSRADDYKLELEALNTRMEAVLARYTKQFSVMEALVGQTNTMRDSLTASFDGMMAMYTNN